LVERPARRRERSRVDAAAPAGAYNIYIVPCPGQHLARDRALSDSGVFSEPPSVCPTPLSEPSPLLPYRGGVPRSVRIRSRRLLLALRRQGRDRADRRPASLLLPYTRALRVRAVRSLFPERSHETPGAQVRRDRAAALLGHRDGRSPFPLPRQLDRGGRPDPQTLPPRFDGAGSSGRRRLFHAARVRS